MTDLAALEPADLDAVLPALLAAPGLPRAGSGQIDGFYDYLAEGALTWKGLRVGPRHAPRGVFLAILLPGRTAIVMVPTPGQHGIDFDDQVRVTMAGLEALGRLRLHYAQVLLEMDADAKRRLIAAARFSPLAPLAYLERDAVYPWLPPPPQRCHWVPYGPATQAQFAEAVLGTYHGSLDCPELTGIRPIADILAAHKASGPFDPALWELAIVDGEPVACLLLSRLAQGAMVEIVYMGVLPAWRRRGYGKLLLARAFEHARAIRARRVTVVVDDRNAPAKRLYEGTGFTPAARRDAFIYCWR
jgi:GNAT superfamily N-acetyltransferase